MEIILFSLFLFLFGIFFGSFLNVLIDRIPRGEKIAFGRSYCEFCKKTLQWYDLVPLLSFLQIGGRCRYCKEKLSWYYPLIEATTGLLFVATFLILSGGSSQVFLNSKFLTVLLYYLFVDAVLIVLFFTDLRSGIIPFAIILPAIVISLIFLGFVNPFFIYPHLLAAIGGSVFFLLLIFLTKMIMKKEGMGFGDVVLAFYMGLLLRFPDIILAYYVAFLTGAVVSLILILGKKKKLRGGTIPFGPFLILGTLISLFFGEKIIPFVIYTLYG